MVVISRNEAKALGMKRYFTGIPCSRGHVDERLISSYGCVSCHAINLKEYKERNPHAGAMAQKRYRERNPEKSKEYSRKYGRLPEIKEYRKNWLKTPKGIALSSKRRIGGDPDLIAKDRERCREKYQRDKEAQLLRNKNNRIKRRGAEGTHGIKDIRELMRKQDGLCANCRINVREKYHVDHIMPLYLGGSNWPENLQILCPRCNMSKGALHPDEWLKREGRA